MSIRLGYQIPNFTYPGGRPAAIGPTVIAQAREAEAAGVDAVFVMDHFYQLPGLGAPEDPMLECYTLLGAIAASTSRIQLSSLVTGNTYRNPTLLAKAVTTLDVVSAGRAILGLGAGWFELEHEQLGFEFGTFTERFHKLNEALEIILPMIAGERPTVNGRYYRTRDAMANPRYRDHIPLLIGGSGEKKTIPLAVKHFDHLNLIANLDELPGKLAVVRDRCEETGRDPATLETSTLLTVVVDEKASLDQLPEAFRGRAAVGSPATVAEQIKTKVFDVGLTGVIFNLPLYTPGVVAALAEALRPVLPA